MKYTGTLSVTPLQVGDYGWINLNNEPKRFRISRSETQVYKDEDDVTQETIRYGFAETGTQMHISTSVFATKEAITGDYEDKADDEEA